MSLTSRSVAAVFEALGIVEGKLEEAFDELEAEEGTFALLKGRYRAAQQFGLQWGEHHEVLLSWLVAKAGPALGISCAALEALIVECARGPLDKPLVTPQWALAEPLPGALQRRVPCRGLVAGEDEDIARAYDGLVKHVGRLAALPPDDQAGELLNTAIPWRILALADKLEPEQHDRDSIKTRLGRLRSRTVGGAHADPSERRWWNALDETLVPRRHALSHLGRADGWSFGRCVDELWPLATALEATAAISLSVMAEIARSQREGEPPAGAFGAVMGETDWLKDHVK